MMAVIDNQTQRAPLRADEAQKTVWRRAQYLTGQDRALLELVLKTTASHREIGQLLGIPSGTVTRRIKRLADRLYDPLIVALLERPDGLRDEYRQLGIEYYLHNRAIRELADLHRMSTNKVKRIISYLKGWHGRSTECVR